MGFVESFSIGEPDDDAEAPQEHVRPPWQGPPEDELGVAVPQGLVITRSGRGVGRCK